MLIQISNLTKKYHHYIALDAMDLQIPLGKIIGLFGQNGSGKTTLLKILSGLITKYQGHVLFEQQSISQSSKAHIAYLPDISVLPPHWNLQYACGFFTDFFKDFDAQRALYFCQELHLDPKAKFKTLSKGNQEKLLLLLTLSRNAKLYLLDEPISGADPIVRKKIFDYLCTYHRKDSTIIIATHLITYVQSIIHEAIFLNQGKISFRANESQLSHIENLEDYFGEYCNVKTS